MCLVKDPNDIKLAMLGMVEGNGHPYSWSAIINGEFDAKAMADCGYPVIPQYLAAAPDGEIGITGAKVTHVWCDDKSDAEKVAKTAFIPNVVNKVEDVIGEVDAVLIATDKGWEHLKRVRPFIEAGVPVFIDKPLTDNETDLMQFIKWQKEGKAFMSTSSMRYAKELHEAKKHMEEIGELRLITMTMAKTWERYGIHALEGVYPFLAPGGWISVTNTGTEESNIVHCKHESGVDVILTVIDDMYGAFGCLNLYGTKGKYSTQYNDYFCMFKNQLNFFVDYLRTGKLPFDFLETIELMKIIIAGIKSRNASGETIFLSDIQS